MADLQVSVGGPATPAQEDFVRAVEDRLRGAIRLPTPWNPIEIAMARDEGLAAPVWTLGAGAAPIPGNALSLGARLLS